MFSLFEISYKLFYIDESEQPEPKPNEILTNIIKDSSKINNEDNQDYDDDDIQEKMSGIINDLKSESIVPDDKPLLPRKSITSNHLDNQESNSTPIIDDSTTEKPPQPPTRSMSETVLNDQNDKNDNIPTLPVQQNESSTEEEDDDDNDRSSNRTPKQNNFDETTRFGTVSTDIKQAPLSDELDTDRTKSSRSATPSTNSKLPNAIVSPPSRRESTNKSDQQQPSESAQSSTNDFQPTHEQSKLIKSGEQLQIPTNDINNERINSPPPSPSATKQIVQQNPLLDKNSRTSSRKSSANNEKLVDSDIISSRSRRSSNTSQKKQQQQSTNENNSSNEKDHSRRSSATDTTLVKQKNSATKDQSSRVNSNKSQTKTSSIKRSSVTDSENEKLPKLKSPRNPSGSQRATPTGDKQTNQWTKQIPIPPIQTTDDEIQSSRPQSPNVEQIAERNPPVFNNKKKKDPKRLLQRSNSFESFNHIPLVDDKSLDSTSGNNTETENSKQRRIKSKKKDMETNTDSKVSSRNDNYQQQGKI